MIAYLDTHVVVMITQSSKHLPRKATAALRRASELRVSPAALLELQFLREIGRVNASPDAILAAVNEAFSLTVCGRAFADVVRDALSLGWTRDPFDRFIVGQAMGSILITKDQAIRANYDRALWD